MSQSHFSLAWDAHKRSICSGLSSLQQNSEFVDMTLAADGHLVKVHQIVMVLASPYIKELITSAQCSHPIIFLNKISYTTLCSILEYIYTGEVLVSSDNLDELIETGKELHIKGLEDMKVSQNVSNYHCQPGSVQSQDEEDVCYFEITEKGQDNFQIYTTQADKDMDYEDKEISYNTNIETKVRESFNESMQEDNNVVSLTEIKAVKDEDSQNQSDVDKYANPMQYTVSNQGSLQMILNRYVYYLKHSNRNNSRQWRCVDYVTSVKCPAHVVTKDDIVLQRIAAHTHPFHDKRILKKVHAGAIFTAIHEAEKQGHVFSSKKKALTDNGENK